ncbi:ribulose-phosphate 3-epimerase [bacterium]|nr:ribulose-phosphate 3-epimerase [bacterium]
MTIISPSILSADFANLERDIKRVESAGADWLHIDVMDGHFVPNITIGVPVVKSVRKITKLPLDVHLMIENPDKYIEPFAKAGADVITFHYEAVDDNSGKLKVESGKFNNFQLSTFNFQLIKEIINKIHSFGIKSGMSIKPKTPAEVVFPYLNDLDMVLVMTVEPGFGGQKFMPDCAEKIPIIKEKAPQNLIIQVDGGINDQTAKICTSFGANSLVAGNYIYSSDDINKAVSSLRI